MWLGKGSLCTGMILFGLEILLRACGHPLADDLVDRFSVPFLMYGVWSVVPSTAWRSRLLSCTFPIYLLHAFVAVAFMAGLKVSGLNRIASPSLTLFLVKGMAMLGGAMILSMCFRRLFPKISAIAFGGR